jgi:hypothetical protein
MGIPIFFGDNKARCPLVCVHPYLCRQWSWKSSWQHPGYLMSSWETLRFGKSQRYVCFIWREVVRVFVASSVCVRKSSHTCQGYHAANKDLPNSMIIIMLHMKYQTNGHRKKHWIQQFYRHVVPSADCVCDATRLVLFFPPPLRCQVCRYIWLARTIHL